MKNINVATGMGLLVGSGSGGGMGQGPITSSRVTHREGI